MNRYKKYPKYKDSGVEWLGEIPEGWDNWKLSHSFRIIGSGTTPKSDDMSYYEGDIPWVNTSELRETEILDTNSKITLKAIQDYSILKFYPPGTLLFAMYGATIGRLGILGINATVNQACCAFANSEIIHTKFLFYWLLMRKPVLIGLSSGGGQPNLNQEKLREIIITTPSLPEQTAIAAFLDRETARIDALIEKKQRQIELLQEKRAALISQAVTKGLDPTVKMKDSGVPWLGEVPEHWELLRLKFLTRAIIDTEHKTAPFFDDGEYLVLRTSNIKKGQITLNDAKYTNESGYLEWTQRGVPTPGDVIFTREAPPGEACLVPDKMKVCLGQRTVLFQLKQSIIDPHYCLFSIYGGIAGEFIQLLSQGSTVSHFNMSDISNIPFLIPPLTEQTLIVKNIQQSNAKIDKVDSLLNLSLQKLQEYRSALISAAVTGKIDLREVVEV